MLERAQEMAGAPRLATAEQVMAPLAPRNPEAVWADAILAAADEDRRHAAFGGRLPELAGPLTLAQTINATLTDAMAARPEMLVFGQDVARKGGVYGVTRGLLSRFGGGRVFDTLLDEQAILGLALGAGLAGLLPVPEIQYLAYLHNAADQIRGEARHPAVLLPGPVPQPHGGADRRLRLPGGLRRALPQRQRGRRRCGTSRAWSSPHPPGPTTPPRCCAPASRPRPRDGSVCVFLEPIALYHTRDLYKSEDGAWLAPYEPPEGWTPGHVPIGRARTYGDGTDLTIMTFGNGLRMSLRAAARLSLEGIRCRVVDLRWLAPLPVEDILREARATGRVLIADETRRTAGVSRRSAQHPRRRPLRRLGGAGDQRGQLHPARRRSGRRAALPAGHRDGRPGVHALIPPPAN